MFLAHQKAVNAVTSDRGLSLSVKHGQKLMDWFKIKLLANGNKITPEINRLRPAKLIKAVIDIVLTFLFVLWIYHECTLIKDNFFIKAGKKYVWNRFILHFRLVSGKNTSHDSHCGYSHLECQIFVRRRWQLTKTSRTFSKNWQENFFCRSFTKLSFRHMHRSFDNTADFAWLNFRWFCAQKTKNFNFLGANSPMFF